MRIDAKVNADLVALTVKRNQKHDGQEAFVDLEVGVRQQEADRFGADFGDLAFGSMREATEDGTTRVEHLQDNITPSHKRVIYERHVIVLDGNKLTEQPKLASIKTVDGEAKVVARFRVPVATTQATLLTKLMAKVNGNVTVEFSPEQELIDLRQKPDKPRQLEVVDP